MVVIVGRADHVLAIDQGTTSTRAILFDAEARAVFTAQRELEQHYPGRGWVEHDPERIWQDTLAVVREALGAVDPQRVAGIGITNQRETILLWDRATGRPLHNAIVWQDRRTADLCAALRDDGVEAMVQARTGLLLDPYFSASKLKWLLDHVEGARKAAARGTLAAGTIDSFLLWQLTGGRAHATDVTNASRTMLYDIVKGAWDAGYAGEGVTVGVLDGGTDFGHPDLLGTWQVWSSAPVNVYKRGEAPNSNRRYRW